jgi:hypothetical protein
VKKIISIMGLTIQKVKLIHYLATIENESDWTHIKVKPMSFQNEKLGNN